nr:reverse transcriptase domain-containing protein [Tanacetum cinerariifolium]
MEEIVENCDVSASKGKIKDICNAFEKLDVVVIDERLHSLVGWSELNKKISYETTLFLIERLPLGLSFLPLVYESASSGIQSSGNIKMSGNEDHHRQGRRFAAGGNRHDGRDPRDVEIERLRQRVRELEINPFDRYEKQYEDTPTDTVVEEYENEGSEFEKNSPASSALADPSPTTPSAIPGTTTD